MRRILAGTLIAISAVAVTQFAKAADLPVKAPPQPPPPVSTWTGCYGGLNAGGVWGRMHDDWTPDPTGFSVSGPVLQANGTGTIDGAGFTGGGQVGCNWQTNAFVLGAEADVQYTGVDASRDVFVPPAGGTTSLNFHEDFRSRWLATFRGRLGWLINPSVLVYGTGGLAVADVDSTDSVVGGNGVIVAGSSSETRTGWTAGGGVEWMFAPRWSVKAEYLYVALGSFSTVGVAVPTVPNGTIAFDHHNISENIARLGVNYHF